MHLLRIRIPDRPGSLGEVASAMGSVGADISAMEIVEKGDGWVVDDFMLTLGGVALMDTLVSTCTELADVEVLWVSRYPDTWGLEGDIEVLNRMSAEPEHSVEILVDACPVVFHCQWAALVEATTTAVRHGSPLAPERFPAGLGLAPVLGSQGRADLPAGWLPDWGETTIAFTPLGSGDALVLGRLGGPDFLDSELRRLHHLAALA